MAVQVKDQDQVIKSSSEDHDQGLLPALTKLFPFAEHRYCVRHINENMNQTWKGAEYNEMLWKCATSITEVLFEKNMQELKDFNKKSYEWLHKIPLEHWSRAYFSGRAHFIQKCDGPLTPAVAKLFDKIKTASTGCTVEWNGSELYQDKGSHPEQYVVNLTQKTCSCRKWEISGIPCKHAIVAIHDMIDNGFDVGIPEDWVHDSYKLQTWMNVYSHKVNPVNGRDMWSKFDCPTTLLPPKVHLQIGRPPKKRKKSKGEIVMVKGNKLTRQGKTVTCSLCQAAGHNKTSCLSVASQRNESVPKKTTSTKRTSSVTGTSIAAAEVGTQAGTQASTGSTFKRTKKSESRLTPEK
ncbi:mutator type transposase [Tanacetum coccineum]